jgi:hypothetical protein
MGAGGFGGGSGIRFTIEADDRASPQLNRLVQNLRGVDAAASKMATGFTRFQASIVTFAAGVTTAIVAVRAVADVVDTALGQVVRRGEELQGLSRRLSVSVETLSGFRFAAEQAGVSLESLGGGFRKLAQSLVESQRAGTTANKILVQGLGFTIEQLKSLEKDPTRAVLALSDAFNRYEDSARKTLAAQELFGRGGQSFLQFFKEGRGEIEKNIALAQKLGLVWSTEQAAAADRLGDAVTSLFAAFEGLLTRLVGNETTMNGLAAVAEKLALGLADIGRQIPDDKIRELADAATNLGVGLADLAVRVIPDMIAQLGPLLTFLERLLAVSRDFAAGAASGGFFGGIGNVLAAPAGRSFSAYLQSVPTPGGLMKAGGVAAPTAGGFSASEIAKLDAFGRGGAPAGSPFPFSGSGGAKDKSADEAARTAEQFAARLRDLRNEITLLQDPTQKFRIEEEKLVEELTKLATQAKLPTDGIKALAAEHRKAAEAAEAHKKAEEELEK